LSKVILAAKKLYYDKLLCKSNNKTQTTWQIVKTITNHKETSSNLSILNFNDSSSNNPFTLSNTFNTYFSSAAENLLKKNLSGKSKINDKEHILHLYQSFQQPFPTMKLRNTTTNEIDKIIYSLKSMNSHGYDKISTRILKASAPFVLSPLTYIFNTILSTGIFPDRLKYAEVKPQPKKGDKSESSNYRPISLLISF
jgi:hypothetical protein